jgi:hypothetical protein
VANSCVQGHTVHIYDRGGMNRLTTLTDLSMVEYTRLLEDKSGASVELSGASCTAQAEKLAQIAPRRHEMVIYRGKDRVWEGPIVSTLGKGDQFTINANDVLEYVDYTSLSKAWPTKSGYRMLDRINDVVRYEMTKDYTVKTSRGNVLVKAWENISPPANVVPYLIIGSTKTTRTTAVTEPFEMSVGAHIRDLAEAGVSFTTLGRSILFWDGDLSETRTMTERDFNGDLEVIQDGGAFFTVEHVIGQEQEEDEPAIIGHSANKLDFYGPWEHTSTVENESSATADEDADELDDAEILAALQSQANKGLAKLYPVPILLQAGDGAKFQLTESLGINDLIAGINVPVRASQAVTQVKQMQRLISLRVTETAEGEEITGQLDAVGTLTSAEVS